MIKARIVGPREELGVISEDGLDFYGHAIHRDWTELVDPKAETLRKLRGNRHVEVSGGPKAATPEAAPEAEKLAAPGDEESVIRAELLEFGIEAKPDAMLRVLKMQLGKARKASQSQD